MSYELILNFAHDRVSGLDRMNRLGQHILEIRHTNPSRHDAQEFPPSAEDRRRERHSFIAFDALVKADVPHVDVPSVSRALKPRLPAQVLAKDLLLCGSHDPSV